MFPHTDTSLQTEMIAERIAGLMDQVLDAKEAARCLKLSDDAFRKLAPSLPRCKMPNGGYRYLRSELLGWLRAQRDLDGNPGGNSCRQPDGNPLAHPRTTSHTKGKKEKVTRLV